MARRAASGDLGSHPDIYGRLWWDRPAVTIKRECSHVGNGRYAHPEQDRLCTVREMSLLQGFPRDYQFTGTLANMYRHIGDAVPPLISYQLAALCRWILTGVQAGRRGTDPAGWRLPPGRNCRGDLTGAALRRVHGAEACNDCKSAPAGGGRSSGRQSLHVQTACPLGSAVSHVAGR